MVNWVDVVGSNVVASLAKQADVNLTSSIITLLEKFGDCVERESRTRHLRHRRVQRIQTELRLAHAVVKEEVGTLRESILKGRLNDPRSFYVLRHPETYLPIVYLKLKALPELVLHINRTYATDHKGVTFGFRTTNYCGGRLTGPVAQAANFLTEQCKQANWKVSVSEVIHSWIRTVMSIPPSDRSISERMYTKKRPAPAPRQRGKWKAQKIVTPISRAKDHTADDSSSKRQKEIPVTNEANEPNEHPQGAGKATGTTKARGNIAEKTQGSTQALSNADHDSNDQDLQ